VYLRFTRAAFVGCIACFFTVASLVENPALWGSQIARHVDKNGLIQPGADKIIELDSAFDWWLDNGVMNATNYITFYASNITDTSKPMEDEYYRYEGYSIFGATLSRDHFMNGSAPGALNDFQRLVIVDYFIQNYVMRWTDDSTTHDVSDHVPVPDEALSRWQFNETWRNDPGNASLRAWDDCDGIAVVTVSFLRRLQEAGIIPGRAYIASGKGHWFTAVFLNETTPVVFLNHWKSIHVYGIYMDNNLPAWGQNIYTTIKDAIITNPEDVDEFLFYIDFIAGNVGILLVLAVLVSILATLFFGYPRDYETGKERERVSIAMEKYKNKPKIVKYASWLFLVKIGNPFQRRHMYFWLNVLFTSASLVAGVLALRWLFLATSLYTYMMMFMYFAIFSVLFLLDKDVYVHAFRRLYFAIKKQPHELLR
nr:hypothetical protein [Candidatus Sigynarchaeota archaeon]